MNREVILKRNPDLVTADMDGCVVMLDANEGVYYNLGKIGSSIWNLLENEKRVDEIIDDLLNCYEVGREQCENEVFPFLDTLLGKEIILAASTGL